jgi:hypothetical protein
MDSTSAISLPALISAIHGTFSTLPIAKHIRRSPTGAQDVVTRQQAFRNCDMAATSEPSRLLKNPLAPRQVS